MKTMALAAELRNVVSNIEKVIIGKRDAIELVMCAFLRGGHVLIEDVPGVGKTSLVSALAKSVDCSFRRIQFTPDILPSDITGFSVFNPKTGQFVYREGVVMANIVLADEINRTSPKTQAGLLEVMEEGRVTVDGVTYPLPKPFIVLATQNPVEYLGTSPLPEAQLDRFFLKVSLGYPKHTDEVQMLGRFQSKSPLDRLSPVVSATDMNELIDAASYTYVSPEIADYIVRLLNETRKSEYVYLGASPRASLCLLKAAQARAFYQGRDFVTPDDVLFMTVPVVEHRIVLTREARIKRVSTRAVIETAQRAVSVPL